MQQQGILAVVAVIPVAPLGRVQLNGDWDHKGCDPTGPQGAAVPKIEKDAAELGNGGVRCPRGVLYHARLHVHY